MAAPSSQLCLRHFGIEKKIHVPARTFQLLARSSNTSQPRRSPRSRKFSSNATEGAQSSHEKTKHNDYAENSPLAEAVKLNMRAVKYPVAIITSSNPKMERNKENPTAWKGATVASFTTVSMKPVPLVSFNMHHKSSTLAAVRTSGYFAVNILNQAPNAAYLADLFAKPNDESPFLAASKNRDFYAGRKWFLPDHKMRKVHNPYSLPPRLQYKADRFQPRAVLFSLLCHTTDRYVVSAGDHVVVLGRVVHVLSGKGTRTFLDPQRHSPASEDIIIQEADNLTYQHGRYSAGPDDVRPSRGARVFASVTDSSFNWNQLMSDESHGQERETSEEDHGPHEISSRDVFVKSKS